MIPLLTQASKTEGVQKKIKDKRLKIKGKRGLTHP